MGTEVPEGWMLSRVGSFSWEVSERSASGTEEVLSVTKHRGFVPSLEYFGKQVFSKDIQNYKLVRQGQFAYATIHLDEGSIDSLRIRDEGIISPMYTVFDTDPCRVDRKYLLSLLRTPMMLNRYATIGKGSINRRKSISFSTLAAEAIPLPPLPEQRKIAAILTSVDEAIQATQAVIEQTRRVKEGLLQELLTKGIGHTRFKQTPIGEIPEAWQVKRLSQLLESCVYGVSCSLQDEALGLPVLRMGNIHNDRLRLSHLRYADLSGYNQTAIMLRTSDLIFNRTNSWDLVGKVALVPANAPTLSFASYLLRLRTIPQLADSRWLWAVMASTAFQYRLRSLATKGVSQVNINPTSLKGLEIAVPLPSEQQAIYEKIEQLELLLVSHQKCETRLKSAKAGLLQDLLTGKKRVTP